MNTPPPPELLTLEDVEEEEDEAVDDREDEARVSGALMMLRSDSIVVTIGFVVDELVDDENPADNPALAAVFKLDGRGC